MSPDVDDADIGRWSSGGGACPESLRVCVVVLDLFEHCLDRHDYSRVMASRLDEAISKLGPALRKQEFHRFGRTFNREREPGLIQVIGFQGSQSATRFTVNIGIYVREVDALVLHHARGQGDALGRTKAVRAELCWLEARIGKLAAADPRDVWWEYEQLAEAVPDIERRLAHDVIPVLDQSATRAELIEWWEKSGSHAPVFSLGPRWGIAPPVRLGFVVLLNAAGRVDDARALLRSVWDEARQQPYRFTVEVVGEDLGLEVSGDTE